MLGQLTRTAGAALLSTAILFPGVAEAASKHKNAPLLVGPPVTDIKSPYDGALRCINTVLTDKQRMVTFTVQSFVDKTNKANFVSDSGVGSFSSQGIEDMMYTSLTLAGVAVTDMSLQQRAMMDWSLMKILQHNQGAQRTGGQSISVGFKFPDVSITGAISTFDINVSSKGFSIKVQGIGASARKDRILVGMDARLSEMTGGQRPDGKPMEAGMVRTAVRINKQVIGYDLGAGATRFFSGGSSTLIDIDLGGNRREAIQYIERIMTDGLVARLITQYFGITACDEHIAYGDNLLVPPEDNVDVPTQATAQRAASTGAGQR